MPAGPPSSLREGGHSEVGPPEAASRLPRIERRLSRVPILLCLLLILLTAGLLRTLKLRDLPAGFYCDEAALGYNAWAILHYGVDENGVRMPLFLWSFVSYKNPLYLYSAMLPIGVLGLNEFSLRLTSAAFGTATVLALFFLGRALSGNGVGLAAAALLAICPWHIHFSRIGFELVSFPLPFVLGLVFLIRFTQGRRTLPLAFFFFGSCLYAYAIAKLFVPLFLIGFGLLYLPTVKPRLREWLAAMTVLLATVAPVVGFDIAHRERAAAYFGGTSILHPHRSAYDLLLQFGVNYARFFSPRFLFQQGDRLLRHAVRGHGELYSFFAPFLLIGLLVLLLKRDRPTKLILLWLLLYPVGASLMNEIPSASRSFIGVAAFCLTTSIGMAAVLKALARTVRRPSLAFRLQAAAVAAIALVGSIQTARYLRLYVNEYPKYAAPTYAGFQYGYREVVATMEPQRSKYSLMMLTATAVNAPEIFPLFYNRLDPRVYARTADPGYLVLEPAEYGSYSLEHPVLYALRSSELSYFSDYTIQKPIVAPGGQVEFVVAEVRSRKNYITSWETLGPFGNADGTGIDKDFIDVADITRRLYDTRDGHGDWRQSTPESVRTDLNSRYRDTEDPTRVCAYARTVVEVPSARKALLELSGSRTPVRVWLNGKLLMPAAVRLGSRPDLRAIDLLQGKNTLLVKSCKRLGDWFFVARMISTDQTDMPDVFSRADIPKDP